MEGRKRVERGVEDARKMPEGGGLGVAMGVRLSASRSFRET